jgi:uncharacterized protein (DUF1684 family)
MGFLLTSSISFAQDKEYVEEINRFQEKLNNQYTDAEDSPLLKKDLKKFTGHDFFPTNVDFRVNAKLDFFEDSIIFGMLTSTSRIAEYKKYAIASFEIKGKSYQLTLYRSTTPSEDPEYIDHVFLPFTDETNGDSTYGGGRYIDLKTTNNDTIIIDFNKSYNPYCAYSPFYSCPKPPKENHLNIRIDAGILKPGL